MTIATFILRRLLAMAVILAIVSFLVFGLLAAAPGDPVTILLGPIRATPEEVARIRALYHLDVSFLEQYRYWVGNALHGDFGRSIRSGLPVTSALGERLPITGVLAIYSFVLTAIVAIPAGLAAGVRRGSRLDRAVTFVGLFGLSAPVFAIGVLLIYVFAVALGWFPTFGAGDGFGDRLYHLTLPAITLSLGQIAIVARQTRAASLAVATRDYVTFARARATPAPTIWRAYILRNALVAGDHERPGSCSRSPSPGRSSSSRRSRCPGSGRCSSRRRATGICPSSRGSRC